MKPVFKICKGSSYSVNIIGLEKEDQQYSTTLIDEYGVYRYTDTVAVNVLTSLNSNEQDENSIHEIVLHKEEDLLESSSMLFPKDGLFRITRIIIPTLNWLEEFRNLEYDENIYENIYIYNDGLFYKVKGEEFTLISISDLVKINPCEKSTVFFDYQYTFSTGRLQDCYYKSCQSFFDNLNSCNLENSENIRNRDMIWITINVIKYLLDLLRYFEALKVLEKVTRCGGLCQSDIVNKTLNYGCGC